MVLTCLVKIGTFVPPAFLIQTLTSSQRTSLTPLSPGLAYHKAVYTSNTWTSRDRSNLFNMPERSMLPVSTQLAGGEKTRLLTPLVVHYELNTNCNSCLSTFIAVILVINTIQVFHISLQQIAKENSTQVSLSHNRHTETQGFLLQSSVPASSFY